MDVFGIATSAFLRDAVIAAAHDLEGSSAEGHRRRALNDVIAALGLRVDDLPPRPDVPREGWGRIAEVIRTNVPLPVERGEALRRLHVHLATAGADAAQETMALIRGDSLVDLGGGAGAYTQAFLDGDAKRKATLVDVADIIELARERVDTSRVALVASDILDADVPLHHVALLANVLHLHGPSTCKRLVERAAAMVEPGGCVVIKDLRVDDGRAGPLEGLLFALNMALYTDEGSVYETSQLRGWLAEAGLVDIVEHRLSSSPNAIVMIGRRQALHPGLPKQLRQVIVEAGADKATVQHYSDVMPRMRDEQLRHPLFQALLDWDRLPRMTNALNRLRAVLVDAGVDANIPIGAPTLAALHEGTHYGGAMPMLYGYPADLDYFLSRGLTVDETIDRYLTAPVVHELCHLDRDRDALPPHLDECVAGWLGMYVWPEFAYPELGHDDAIYAAPWLGQIGQAMARTFGVREVLRAHAGYPSTLPSFESAYWEDWRQRRTLHFLSDTMNPEPWLAGILDGRTLDPDRDFDRRIVGDALRAMCLATENIRGSFRTRTELPRGPIVVDAEAHRVMTAPHNALDVVPPRYWLPPCVRESCEVTLTSLDEIPALVERLVP